MSEPELTITCFYSCDGCALEERPVEVPARDPEMVVTKWLEEIVGAAIAKDHSTVSPHCPSRVMRALRIPLPKGADYVGQPAKH